MRIAELLFLVLLLLYHVVLLVPRYRRAFPLNYLVFLSGIALALSLGLEGLRWQMLPPTLLLLVDLLWLFPTFSTLRGRLPGSGAWALVKRAIRSLAASLGFLLAVGSLGLAILFPLPRVPLSGGLPVSVRQLSLTGDSQVPALDVTVWYPASGNASLMPRINSSPAWWRAQTDAGAVPPYWQAYLERLPSNLIAGGKMARPDTRYPIVSLAFADSRSPGEWGYFAENLASRGFVVVGSQPHGKGPTAEPFTWETVSQQLIKPFENPMLWLNPERDLAQSGASGPIDWSVVRRSRELLMMLNAQPGDIFFQALDERRLGLLAWKGVVAGSVPEEAQEWKSRVWVSSLPQGSRTTTSPELWITADPAAAAAPLDAHRWILSASSLQWADLSDAAYLKPYLAFFGLKSHPDGHLHAELAEYAAAFFQYTLWGGDGSVFEGTPPPSTELRLLRQ